MLADRVIPACWWESPILRGFPPVARLAVLWLRAMADRRGIGTADPATMAPAIGAPDGDTATAVLTFLVSRGIVVLGPNGTFWICPGIVPQPTTGPMKPDVNPMAGWEPTDNQISAALSKHMGRPVSKAEVRVARSGPPRPRVPTGVPPEVETVWEAWASRQAQPDACRLGPAVISMIRRALNTTNPDTIALLIKYAYEADEPGPRYWRGENPRAQRYLGLDNLLGPEKLPSRIQMAVAWETGQRGGQPDDRPSGITVPSGIAAQLGAQGRRWQQGT